jgi:hypothetical protein
MLINFILPVILSSPGILGLLGCTNGLVHTSLPTPFLPSSDLKDQLVYVLPKGYIKVETDSGYGGGKPEVVYEPDPQHYYLLKYTSNMWYDDDINISLNESGFLSTITTTTTSRAPEIIKKVGEIASDTLRFTAGLTRNTWTEPDNFLVLIDPKDIARYDPKIPFDDKKYAMSKLKITHISLEHPQNNPLYIDPKPEPAPERPPILNQCICYRPTLPYKLRMAYEITTAGYPENKKALVYVERYIYLPNFSRLVTFDITRPKFVTQVQSLTFTNGLLTQVALKKDSELLAALGIPADLVKTVAGLPLELFKVKVQNMGQ